MKGIEFEYNPSYVLLGINYTNWIDEDSGDEGDVITLGFLFFNLNVYF